MINLIATIGNVIGGSFLFFGVVWIGFGLVMMRFRGTDSSPFRQKLNVFQDWIYLGIGCTFIACGVASILQLYQQAALGAGVLFAVVGIGLAVFGPRGIRTTLNERRRKFNKDTGALHRAMIVALASLSLFMVVVGGELVLHFSGVAVPDILGIIGLWTLGISGVGFLGGPVATAILAI